jgi:hypothetical protein
MQAKLNLTTKTNLPALNKKKFDREKDRQIEEKQFQKDIKECPTVNFNDISFLNFSIYDEKEKSLKKNYQVKINKFYQSFKENRYAEEWDLYLRKS